MPFANDSFTWPMRVKEGERQQDMGALRDRPDDPGLQGHAGGAGAHAVD